MKEEIISKVRLNFYYNELNYTYSEIAEMYNTSKTTIQNRMKSYGLKPRRPGKRACSQKGMVKC